MDIHKTLSEFKHLIDEEIEQYLDRIVSDVKKENPFLGHLLHSVEKYILAGGKRLRGALLYYAYKLLGGKEENEILKACAGIELVHNFFLVHDDIIDRDEKRHNRDTLHKEFSKVGKRYFPQKENDHFGVSMAIIAGDLLGSMGSQRIFSLQFPSERIVQALIRLQESISRTGLGQAMDVYLEYKESATEQEVLSAYENKTARYTFECPLHLGGILAGASKDILELFSCYALPIGVAFQLQDDLLGVYGESQKTGKSVGSDIAEGKMTLLVVKALEMGSRNQKKELLRYLGKREGATKEGVARVRKIFDESGSSQYTRDAVNHYLEKSIQVSRSFPDAFSEYKKFFVCLAEYLRERKM